MCTCDDYCIVRGNCCYDVYEDMVSIFDREPKLQALKAGMTCTNFIKAVGHPATYMVTKCPPDSNDAVRQKCEQPVYDGSFTILDNVPYVYDGDVIFKNKYCLRCHNITTNYESLVDMKCTHGLRISVNDDIDASVVRKYCHITIPIASAAIDKNICRFATKQMKCHKESSPSARACDGTVGPDKGDMKMNGRHDPHTIVYDEVSGNALCKICLKPGRIPKSYICSLTSTIGDKHAADRLPSFARGKTIGNVNNGPALQSIFRIRTSKQVRPIEEYLSDFELSLMVRLKLTSKIDTKEAIDHYTLSLVERRLSRGLQNNSMSIKDTTLQCTDCDADDILLHELAHKADTSPPYWATPHFFPMELYTLNFPEKLLSFWHSYCLNALVTGTNTSYTDMVDLLINVTMNRIIAPDNNVQLKVENIQVSLHRNESNWCSSGFVVNYGVGDFHYSQTVDNRVIVSVGGETYDLVNYQASIQLIHKINSITLNITDGSILKICRAFPNTWHQAVSNVLIILSIISLGLVLACHVQFSSLRNLPGKNLMALSFSMMIALFFHLISSYINQYSNLCVVVALAKHYFWLLTFFWMNVNAVDIWRVFHTGTSVSSSSDAGKFWRYGLYANGFSLVIVGASFVLTHAAPLLRFGYGGFGCWIDNHYQNIATFLTPIGILCLVNIVCFVSTICSIHRVVNLSKHVTNTSQNRREFLPYIKMSVLLGVSWVIGFAGSIFDNSILWMVFDVVNGLQGVLILVVFVSNHKVRAMLRLTVRRTADSTVEVPSSVRVSTSR